MDLSDINLDEFIAIDVETTGLDLFNDKIIEISAIKFKNSQIIDIFTKLINPKQKIPSFIENLTGITNQNIVDAPIFNEISNELMNFVDKMPIVGHNVKFDIDFINKEFDGLFDLYDSRMICDTYQLSKIFLYDHHSFKLESLCNYFKINLEVAHRAEDDAKNTGYLFLEILEIIIQHSLNHFNNLYKVYSENMIINKELFFNLINCCLKQSIISINPQDKLSSSKFVYNNKIKESSSIVYSIEDIFKSGGILDSKLDKYQYRKSQCDFALEFDKNIHENEISIVEAETGLGKTYGYLVPSLLSNNKKIIISTSTHNLQEQLFHSDLPCLGKILKVSIYATIVKGMKNYICNYRLRDLIDNIELLNDEDRYELLSLILWANKTLTGDISECNSFRLWKCKKIWDLVCFNHEYCSYHKDDNKKCFYNILKNHIELSNILVINHSLLASCYDKEESIIDNADICVIDEAHKLSENCQMHLKESLNKSYLKSIFDSFIFSSSKILNENRDNNNYNKLYRQINSIRDKSVEILELFEDMSLSFAENKFSLQYNSNKNLINDVRYECSNQEYININPSPTDIFTDFNYFISLIDNFKKLILESNLLYSNKLNKINYSISLNDINDTKELLYRLFNKDVVLTHVHWITISSYKQTIQSVTFNRAPLLIHDVFKNISSKFDSILLTSATLTVNDSFSYVLNDLGLNSGYIDKNYVTNKYNSPFCMENQLKLFINNNYLEVNSKEYIESIYDLVIDINKRIKKRMLVLCTSYKQISDLKTLFDNYEENKNIFFQDSLVSRQTLINQYLSYANSILFGTASFWEGVDFPEDKLEILIIIKMPFSNPYNPIVQAKIDAFLNQNLDPFENFQLSEAILKLKQGIGRLIRKENDMGICIITDPRILKRKYGKIVLDSLPIDALQYKFSSTVIDQSEKFLGI